MDSARPSNSTDLLSLQEAARLLGVSVQVLLTWNEHNILKPTITSTGHIGYTDHQIQQFLTIRKVTQAQAQEKKEHHLQAMGDWAQQSAHKSTLSGLLYPRNSLSFLIGFGTLAGMVTLFLLSSPGDTDTIQTTKSAELAKSQRSTLALTEKTPVTTPVQLNADATRSKNLKVEGNNTDAEQPITQEVLARKTSTNSPDKKDTHESIIALLLGKSKNESNEIPGDADGLSVLSSSGNCIDCKTDESTLAFDEDGNLRGEVEENTAVSTLEKISSGIRTDSAGTNADPRIQFVLLAFGAGILMYVFRRQLAFTIDLPGTIQPTSLPVAPILQEKLLEVSQKTDGAVVVVFEGKEFRLSKPELYSESDQFIERLMELTRFDVKELEYDSQKDETIRLSTPLSRLVTRLGFVGIKRDLFFPRTAKQVVLFRKYITRKDLMDMNLTATQILQALTSPF